MKEPTVTLLLIDDDESDALITTHRIEQASELSGIAYQVEWVDSYRAGLEAALRGGHDLVLVDYELCPGKGIELLVEARRAGCTTPFILLTGMEDREIDRLAMEAGAFDFLSKGTATAELIERSIRYGLAHAHALGTLAAKTRELERSNMELELFARAVSHDLRQPLHVIAGYAELLTMRYEQAFDDRAKQMMGKIVNGVERMNSMIEDLLGLARLDADGDKRAAVDCGRVVAAVVAEFELRLLDVGGQVRLGVLPTVHGRAAHLEQLFRNLLGNAIKFSSDAPARLSVECLPDGECWLFSVRDNGIGVPEGLLESIFEPFQRGHPSDAYPGTGIGLALCRKIVQQHGGRIWVEPAVPAGSVFRFTLPREQGDTL